MAKAPKEGKLIYHLTSIDNLESIFEKGLLSRNDLESFTDIANEEIIKHREEKGLNNLIPFHFFGANPFDGAVQKKHCDKKFVFITIQRTYAKSNGFKILVKHPLSLEDCILFDYDKGIDKINWDKMAERDYSDNECKEICMAECLSEKKVDAKDFFAIYVPDEDTQLIVNKLREKVFGSNNYFHVNVLENIFL